MERVKKIFSELRELLQVVTGYLLLLPGLYVIYHIHNIERGYGGGYILEDELAISVYRDVGAVSFLIIAFALIGAYLIKK
jgi:hypothetical protein